MPKPKKSEEKSVADVVAEIRSNIDEATQPLGDEDYLEVMEEIESYARSCYEAKSEELDEEEDSEDGEGDIEEEDDED
jgi:hypothetical protein